MLRELSLYKELEGFTAARDHIDSKRCCFITAYRRNIEELLAEIKKSGLSYIEIIFGKTIKNGAFCMINNKFKEDDFIRLMVHWCKIFGQERILVSFPGNEKPGALYKADGSIDKTIKEIALIDIDEYFTKIRGKKFNIASSSYIETENRNYRCFGGRFLAGKEFWTMYREKLNLPWRVESGVPKK